MQQSPQQLAVSQQQPDCFPFSASPQNHHTTQQPPALQQAERHLRRQQRPSPQSLSPLRRASIGAAESAAVYQAEHAGAIALAQQTTRAAVVPLGTGGYARWLKRIRRAGPVSGALLVLAAHAVHLLALPLLAAWLGLNAAVTPDSGSLPLGGHASHAGHTGSGSLPMRWTSDLLAAATVAAAISMCGAMARSWRSVRSHPLPCILYTLVAILCVGLILI